MISVYCVAEIATVGRPSLVFKHKHSSCDLISQSVPLAAQLTELTSYQQLQLAVVTLVRYWPLIV